MRYAGKCPTFSSKPVAATVKILLLLPVILLACETKTEKKPTESLPIAGTWELLSGTTVEKTDTAFTDYRKGQRTIKIINDSHFSFLRHDLVKGKDTAAVFVAGGGRYTLSGNQYTEFLDYCNFREWEGNRFDFQLTLKGDTLVQTGREKVDGLGVDRIITETYVRTRK